MKNKTRYVQTEVEVSMWEFSEVEIQQVVQSLETIRRICNLVPQDFDRKGVKDLTERLLEDVFKDFT